MINKTTSFKMYSEKIITYQITILLLLIVGISIYHSEHHKFVSESSTIKAIVKNSIYESNTYNNGNNIELFEVNEDKVMLFFEPIPINSANSTLLSSIPGIGKVLAQRIIQTRKANGPYYDVQDLMKVKGLGTKKTKKIIHYISFDNDKDH